MRRRDALRLASGVPLLTGGLGRGLMAQDQTETKIVVDTALVDAPTTVLDRNGNYVRGILPSEFRLYDNEKLQDVNVDEVAEPISLVVAVQADYKVESVLPRVRKIGSLVQNLVAGDSGEVSVVGFDHRIQVHQDFTSDVGKIQEGLNKLRPGSSTSRMVDTIYEGVRMLRRRPGQRRRVILMVCESLDKGSEGSIREALTQVEIANVQVYALNISRVYTELTAPTPLPRPDAIPSTARHAPAGGVLTPTEQMQITGSQGNSANFIPLFVEIFRATKAIFVKNPVEVFTRYSGGREIGFLTQRDLERAISEIGSELHNQYHITYRPNNRDEGGFHKITVVVNRPELKVRTRTGYWAAAKFN